MKAFICVQMSKKAFGDQGITRKSKSTEASFTKENPIQDTILNRKICAQWENKELYFSSLNGTDDDQEWAWQFLRRNAEYQADWENFKNKNPGVYFHFPQDNSPHIENLDVDWKNYISTEELISIKPLPKTFTKYKSPHIEYLDVDWQNYISTEDKSYPWNISSINWLMRKWGIDDRVFNRDFKETVSWDALIQLFSPLEATKHKAIYFYTFSGVRKIINQNMEVTIQGDLGKDLQRAIKILNFFHEEKNEEILITPRKKTEVCFAIDIRSCIEREARSKVVSDIGKFIDEICKENKKDFPKTVLRNKKPNYEKQNWIIHLRFLDGLRVEPDINKVWDLLYGKKGNRRAKEKFKRANITIGKYFAKPTSIINEFTDVKNTY